MLQKIRDMSFGRKLLVLIAVQLVPLGLAVVSLNGKLQATIDGTHREVIGLNYAEPLADLTSALSEHQIVSTVRLAGSDALRSHGEAMREEAAEMMKVIAEQHALNGVELGVKDEHKALQDAWQALLANADAGDSSVVTQVHVDAVAAATRLRQLVERNSGLAMDPDAVTSSLIGIAVSGVADLFSAGGALATSIETLRREGGDSYDARRVLSAEEGQVREELQSIIEFLAAASAAEPELAGRFDGGFDAMRGKWERMLQQIRPLVTRGTISTADLQGFSEGLLESFRSVHEIHDPISDELRALLGARIATQQRDRWLLLSSVALALLVVGFVSWWMGRQLSGGLGRAVVALNAISRGDLEASIQVDARDEVGAMLSEMAAMRDRLRSQLTAERAQAAENLRIRQALDSSSAAVMLADTTGTIVFMNRTATTLFSEMEPELRRGMPQFEASRIVGSSFDIFHANPGQQRGLLQGLVAGHVAHIPLGGRRMQISAYPVRDSAGASIGYAVEWLDRTAESRVEKEIAQVIGAAVEGELSQRLPLDGKTGFFAALSGQVNSLLEVNQKVFDDLGRVLSALSQGRLTETIQTEYKGAFGRIRDDVNTTVGKLIGVVEQIQMSSDIVNSSAVQLASGNENLSQRTTQQAASLEETAASIEELTSTVRHNADNASQANQLATATRSLAERGGDVVGRAVKAMGEINASSKQIADIVSVIDDIAFQTNLLALNAAVEAARAGEQGRGFAVVASEVRTLARRSADSAKEIKSLIQDSVAKVDNGSQLVDESGRTLEEIVGSVKRVTDLIAEITAASREQATGVDEINKAVSQMDQVTTQNASLVDEASAGTHALSEQSRALAELVAFFDLGTAKRRTERTTAEHAPPSVGDAAPGSKSVAVRDRAGEVAAARTRVATARPAPQARTTHSTERPATIAANGDAGDDWDTF